MPAVAVPGGAADRHHLIAFAQRTPLSPSELDRLTSGWLVIDAQAGVPGAFNRLHEFCVIRLSRYVRSSVRGRDEADDVMQEVFLRMLRALPAFDPSTGHFGRWLFGIARNHLIDLARKEGRLVVMPPEEIGRQLGADASGDDRHALFLDQVKDLPNAQRQVLFLRYVVGLSWAEIGLLLGRSSGAVRMLQQRAHDALRADASLQDAPAA